MSMYEVRPGYHEWNIYRNGEEFYTVDDGYGQLAADQTDNSDIADFRDLCIRYADCICAEVEGMKINDIGDLSCALFIAWARHFGYDEDAISEWSGSAVTNIAIVQDGDGKIHELSKIIDERESWTFDAFQDEAMSYAERLGGCVLALYRKRDIVEHCSL